MRPPGPWEIVIILVIVFIIFGAGKLPQLFEFVGKGFRSIGGHKETEEDEEQEKEVKTTRKSKKRKKKDTAEG